MAPGTRVACSLAYGPDGSRASSFVLASLTDRPLKQDTIHRSPSHSITIPTPFASTTSLSFTA